MGPAGKGDVAMATATKTWKMFLGGEWVDSSRGEAEPDINPSTGESVGEMIDRFKGR